MAGPLLPLTVRRYSAHRRTRLSLMTASQLQSRLLSELAVATATSLVFLAFGMLAVASSLQQIYEKVFGQDHRRDLSPLLTWIGVLCGAVVAESLAERPVSAVAAGGWLARWSPSRL
jgi:CDP-diglyceride synthetase